MAESDREAQLPPGAVARREEQGPSRNDPGPTQEQDQEQDSSTSIARSQVESATLAEDMLEPGRRPVTSDVVNDSEGWTLSRDGFLLKPPYRPFMS